MPDGILSRTEGTADLENHLPLEMGFVNAFEALVGRTEDMAAEWERRNRVDEIARSHMRRWEQALRRLA